jgi:hypothetical protein
MKMPNRLRTFLISGGLTIILSGVPQLAMAADPQNTATSQAPATSEAAPSQSQPLPDSPSSVRPQPPADNPLLAQATAQTAEQQPSSTPRPAGTAAAQIGDSSGNAASKPAGVAIAPAKQHQARSFLIKMGAVVGVGVAIGTVFALSSGSPSRPPGSQ